MRCWHKDLIPVLPRKQLLGQWRECCAIAKNIAEKGTPNHILVNRIMDYPIDHFVYYGNRVYNEMINRNYKAEYLRFGQWQSYFILNRSIVTRDNLFRGWHDNQYLLQCFYNLQEKFDCGGITDEEYDEIHKLMIAKGFRV